MNGTTTGVYILETLLICTKVMELDLLKLICIITDGAPTMIEEKKCVIFLLHSFDFDL